MQTYVFHSFNYIKKKDFNKGKQNPPHQLPTSTEQCVHGHWCSFQHGSKVVSHYCTASPSCSTP